MVTIKALARAFRWRKMLDAGVYSTINDLAKVKAVNATYVSRILRLTLLCPDVVEAILDGRQPAELQLDDLLGALQLDWREHPGVVLTKSSVGTACGGLAHPARLPGAGT